MANWSHSTPLVDPSLYANAMLPARVEGVTPTDPTQDGFSQIPIATIIAAASNPSSESAQSAANSALTAEAEAIIAASQAIMSKASADAAAVSAAIQNTIASTPTALPYEVTAITGGVGTGSGGTPGEYAMVITGGPAGHKAYVTIDSTGKIASYRNANPGLSVINGIPTYSLTSVPGLTGATAPAATVAAIGVGRIFYAPSADGTKMLGWGNNAGALATAPFGGTQLAIPVAAIIAAVQAMLRSESVEGNLVEVIDGSPDQIVLFGAGPDGTFFWSKPPASFTSLITRFGADVSDGSGDLLQILDNTADGVFLLRIAADGTIYGKVDGVDPTGVATAIANAATALATANTALATAQGGAKRQVMRDLATRARGNNQFVLDAMSAPPTVTCAAGSAIPSGLTKSVIATAANAACFNSFGGDVIDGGSGYWRVKAVSYPSGQGNLGSGSNALSWSHEFETDAPKLCIPFAADPTTCFIRLMVDGQYVSKLYTQVNAAGGSSTISVDFSALTVPRKNRRITLEGVGNSGFGGVYVDPLSSVWAPSTGDIIRAVWVSDSIFEGLAGKVNSSNVAYYTPCASWAHVTGAALGWRNNIQNSIGGTGYINPGTRWKYADHIADLTTRNPDIAIITGSVNDLPSISDVDTFGAAALAYWQAARAALPNIPFAIVGLCPGGSATGSGTLASIDAYEAKLAALVASWGDANAKFFPLASAHPGGAYFTGSGTSVATKGDGNSDIYIGGGPHTNEAGDLYAGLRLAADLRNWISSF